MALKITKDSSFVRAIEANGEVHPIIYNDHFIGREMSRDYPNLKEIEIGEGIVEISEGAFEGCTSLNTVKLPASLKLIRQNAFAGCTSLHEIIFDDTVTDIDCWMDRRVAKLSLTPPCNELLIKHLVAGYGEIDIHHRDEYDPHYWD